MKKKIIGTLVIICMVAALGVAGLTSEAAKTKDKASTKTTEQKTEINEKKKTTSTTPQTNKKQEEAKKENKSEVKKANTQKNVSDGKVDATDFIVTINGVEVKFGDDFNTYQKALGEPDNFTQARSCMHDGDDKIYVYGDVTVYTYPEGKKDIVYIVELNGDTPTSSGIKAGSTKEEVIAAYGSNYTEDPVYLNYEADDGATISFEFENNCVIYIELFKE